MTACLPWAGLLVVLVVCLLVLARLVDRRPRWARLARLHADQRGGAQSLSFVLVLPFFVMILLFIVQVSQVMIGTVMVHYAAFAAARTAIVWIPARLDWEPENCIGLDPGAHVLDPETDPARQIPPDPNEPTEGGLTFLVSGESPKLEKIRAAALMALAPACPSRDLGLGLVGGETQIAGTMSWAYRAMAPGSAGIDSIPRRMANKLTYARRATDVRMTFYHRNSDAPHWPPPSTFYQWHPPGTPYFLPTEMDWQDEITITVRHEMALLPGPGRFLASVVSRPDGQADRVAATIRQLGDVHTYPLSASITLGNEGQRSVIPYVHTAY
ncbi:MAG: hypothetical protein JW809_18710 [Pirellulales bacterium]|nr:hypothetical protein [Pirellulales bacterium]